MTVHGWVVMIISMGFVVFLFAYCFLRVLTTPGSRDRLHGALDVDTGDTENTLRS
jgi:hypothetical protein